MKSVLRLKLEIELKEPHRKNANAKVANGNANYLRDANMSQNGANAKRKTANRYVIRVPYPAKTLRRNLRTQNLRLRRFAKFATFCVANCGRKNFCA